MVIYSHSRLSVFEQCKLKFKYKYIDKIITIEKTIEAFLGKTVHNTLEWIYLQIKKNKIPTIDDVISYYANNWKENYDERIKIVRSGLIASDYFNKGVQFLLDYYMRHKPFKDNTIGVEKRVLIDLDGEHKLQGYIDRLVHNTEKDCYEIHDYKTANTLPTQEKMDNDRQLALYSIGVKDIFGHDKEVLLIWHYLAHNQKIISRRTKEQLQKLKEDTLELIKEIESTNDFPPKKSILCNWCEYKNMCLEFNKGQKKLDIW